MSPSNPGPPLDLCFASIRFPPYFGGAAGRFLRYFPALAEQGIRPTVFSALPVDDAPSPAALGRILDPEPVDGFPVHRIVVPSETRPRMRTFFAGLSRFVRSRDTPPDVVHILNLDLTAIPHLWRIRAAGVPVVFSHTLLVTPPDGWRGALWRLHAAIPYNASSGIVVSTEVMREALRAKGVRKPIDAIPNGVDLSRFRPDPQRIDARAIRSERGLPPEARILLAVGAVHRRKRTDLLIEAFALHAARHPLDHLVIAGPEPDPGEAEDFQRALSDLVERNELQTRVHFVGQVRDIERYYRAADGFVLTTSREGQNNSFFEAMACAVPVLTTPFEGREAIHGDPETHYLLADATPESIARGMAGLLDGPGSREMAQNGLAWSREKMGLGRVIDRYAAVYRGLVRS